MPKLHVVACSTRPERKGIAVARWALEAARAEGSFDVAWVDLAEVDLPLFDEPRHPMLQQYEHEHTKRWSALVSAADAYLFVVPEYNHALPPSLVNALDYLVKEWAYKPAGFVSYGGISGGLRSVENSKAILTTLKMMPIPEGVVLPNFAQHIQDNVFHATEATGDALRLTLRELLKWANALAPLRA